MARFYLRKAQAAAAVEGVPFQKQLPRTAFHPKVNTAAAQRSQTPSPAAAQPGSIIQKITAFVGMAEAKVEGYKGLYQVCRKPLRLVNVLQCRIPCKESLRVNR